MKYREWFGKNDPNTTFSRSDTLEMLRQDYKHNKLGVCMNVMTKETRLCSFEHHAILLNSATLNFYQDCSFDSKNQFSHQFNYIFSSQFGKGKVGVGSNIAQITHLASRKSYLVIIGRLAYRKSHVVIIGPQFT